MEFSVACFGDRLSMEKKHLPDLGLSDFLATSMNYLWVHAILSLYRGLHTTVSDDNGGEAVQKKTKKKKKTCG